MTKEKQHVCPWWLGYFLLGPIRKMLHPPEKIVGPYISEGMTLLDFGCAMGYFSLPMAKMAGEKGAVYCVDLQEKMLNSLVKRAKKFGRGERIKPHICSAGAIGLDGLGESIDFALAFHVMHEVPDRDKIFTELFALLKPGSSLLFVEPTGHVNEEKFSEAISAAEAAGFSVADKPVIKNSRAVALKKP